ncbi:anti-sigma factor domain-containing protein [Nocardia sp. NPDC004068]|uniref:anti-sigma factor n=1 Tax=Nocardia sp. NPDC004068 TaxID=3364303 RepID=UPI00368BA7CC
MSTTESPDELSDAIHPYALDATSEFERRRIERARAAAAPEAADRFDAEVARVRELLAELTVVDSLAPPDELEARILAAVGSAPARRTIRPRHTQWLAAAVVAVLVAVGGILVTTVVRQGDSPSPGVSAVRTIERQRDAITRSAELAGGGTIVVRTSAALSLMAVSFEDVPAPGAGRSYQMWVGPGDGVMHSAAVLSRVPAEPVVARYVPAESMAITVEPAGGSPGPTTTPMVVVELS